MFIIYAVSAFLLTSAFLKLWMWNRKLRVEVEFWRNAEDTSRRRCEEYHTQLTSIRTENLIQQDHIIKLRDELKMYQAIQKLLQEDEAKLMEIFKRGLRQEKEPDPRLATKHVVATTNGIIPNLTELFGRPEGIRMGSVTDRYWGNPYGRY